MNSDGKGAEPSLEEVLASIRRIVRTDSAPPPEAHIDPDDDFGLPALFRSSQSSIADQLPPQIGAAILGGTRREWKPHHDNRDQEREESARQAPPAELEHGTAQDPGVAAALSSLAQSLATVSDPLLPEPQRDAPHAGAQSPEEVAAEEIGQEEPALASDEFWSEPGMHPPPLPRSQPSAASDVPRQMVSCKDTLLISRMSQRLSNAAAAAAPDDRLSSHVPAESFGYGPVIPAEFRIPDREPSAAAPGLEGAKSGPSKEPQGDAPHGGAVAEGFIDQAAVALLRPLLKQWLDSNMRSVLEKALHVEAENAKNREP
jgi:cell pole-organizing protein PopZ